MRALLDRHVLPDELPQEPAQRPLRRGARERPLRGQAGDEMRLGAGLGRLPADADRRQNSGCAEAGRQSPEGPLLLAQGRARQDRAGRNARQDGRETGGGGREDRRQGPDMTPQSFVDPASPLPPIPGYSSRGRLERVLREGKFAVTAELNPPDSADPQEVYDRALVLSEVCDAINATDASGANVHMSSVGICSLLTRAGYAVVMQISCRDRNRIAIQGDVLGAAAMGVANILCLTGDGVQAGDQPAAKPVFDLDSTSLLETIRGMRDRRVFLSGRKITVPPQVFLGAAANPFSPPYDYRPLHLAKKVAAGAQFIQTQYCYDMPLLE